MNSGALRRAIGLTFLYIGVFVLLVLVQFSRGPGFSEKLGRLSVSATYPKAQRGITGGAPDSLHLAYAGLSIEVSDEAPAELVAPDGTAKALDLRSVDKLPDGVRIRLDGGTELKAQVASNPTERFTLNATVPTGAAALRLRYFLVRGASVFDKDGHLLLDSEGGPYELSLVSASLKAGQGPNRGLVALESHEGASGSLALVRVATSAATAEQAPAEQFIAQTPKDPTVFKAEVAAWRDKVWAGLSSGRFDADHLTWKDFDGTARFSEKALIAYLAEALARGSYPDALARIKGVRERWPDKLSYISAPFLGGLLPRMQALETTDLTEVKRLTQLVQDKSPAIFEKENLLHFLLDRSPYALAQDAFRFAAAIDPSKLSVRQTVGLLGCMVEARSYLKDEENPFLNLGSATDRLVSAVRKSSGGFFLVTEDDGSTDLRTSLLAGTYLTEYGAAVDKDMLVGVGQSLVEGVLGLSDAQGFLPAKALVRAGALEQKSGVLAPEELYPLAADNDYYPREVSFYRDVAPGVWAWTCAPALKVEAGAARYTFTVRFPAGMAHYMAFYGIKPFTNIQLYDIDYSPDAAFESYDASGYLYHKPASALYIKMKHKKDNETIKLFF